MKISRAFVHRYFISYSASCTGFPGRLPRTADTARTSRQTIQRIHHGRLLTFQKSVNDRVQVDLGV